MPDETNRVTRDAKGREVGIVRYDYVPARPWPLHELICGIVGISLGTLLVGGVLLGIVFRISNFVSPDIFTAPLSLGFYVGGLAGVGLAAWWTAIVTRFH